LAPPRRRQKLAKCRWECRAREASRRGLFFHVYNVFASAISGRHAAIRVFGAARHRSRREKGSVAMAKALAPLTPTLIDASACKRKYSFKYSYKERKPK